MTPGGVSRVEGHDEDARPQPEEAAGGTATRRFTCPRGTRLGRYEISDLIGAGGMGEIYRARDTLLGRDVAIKVIPEAVAGDADRLRRFEREARAAGVVNHPNILDIHDFGTHEGAPYVVTELLEGETLRRRLGSAPLPLRKAIDYALQVARGLAAAHEKGVLHRDLKPDNLFLTRDGRVKILDFGLAKLYDPRVEVGRSLDGERDDRARLEEVIQGDTVTQTVPGIVLGTAGYMSPEQVRGEPVDPRSDIFAFGAVFYEMLSGRRAFHRDSAVATLNAILSEDPPALSSIDRAPVPAIESIVNRCLEKRPQDRFASAHDLVLALEAVSGLPDIAAGPPTAWRAKRLRRPAVAVPAALGVAVIAAAAVWVFQHQARGVGGVGAQAPAIRMAVLPFANLTGDPEQEYLSDGFTQELIAQLARLHPGRLSVIARSSVMRYKKGDTPVDQIGRDLRVDYVLEGSARREASLVRITAQLVHVRDQTQLWADAYERELSSRASRKRATRARCGAAQTSWRHDGSIRVVSRPPGFAGSSGRSPSPCGISGPATTTGPSNTSRRPSRLATPICRTSPRCLLATPCAPTRASRT